MTKPVIGFHKVLLVRGWSLRVEQDWTCKFAEMTLKRSGNFINLRERIRSATACRLYLFSFSDETEQPALISVVQAQIEKVQVEIGYLDLWFLRLSAEFSSGGRGVKSIFVRSSTWREEDGESHIGPERGHAGCSGNAAIITQKSGGMRE